MDLQKELRALTSREIAAIVFGVSENSLNPETSVFTILYVKTVGGPRFIVTQPIVNGRRTMWSGKYFLDSEPDLVVEYALPVAGGAEEKFNLFRKKIGAAPKEYRWYTVEKITDLPLSLIGTYEFA